MATYYDILEVGHCASVQEIRVAFRKRALSVHPDKGGSKEAFQSVLLSFETLIDSTSRANYDRRLLRVKQTLGSTVATLNGTARRTTVDLDANFKKRDRRAPDSCRKVHSEKSFATSCSGAKTNVNVANGIRRTATVSAVDERQNLPEKAQRRRSSRGSGDASSFTDTFPTIIERTPCTSTSHGSMSTSVSASAVETTALENRSVSCDSGLPSLHSGEIPADMKKHPSDIANSLHVPGASAATRTQEVLGRIAALLGRLSSLKRRAVIQNRFTQQQRLALETWILQSRQMSSSDDSSLPTNQMDFSSLARAPSCSSESSEYSSEGSESEIDYEDDDLCDLVQALKDGHHDVEPEDSESGSESVGENLNQGCDEIHGADEIGSDAGASEQSERSSHVREGEEATVNQEISVDDLQAATERRCPHSRYPRNKTGVRGLKVQCHGTKFWYAAIVMLDMICMYTKSSTELSIAVDNLAILTAIKMRALSLSADVQLAVAIQTAAQCVLAEHGVSAQDVGLSFRMQLVTALAPVMFYTPIFKDISLVHVVFDHMEKFRSRVRGVRGWRVKRDELCNFDNDWQRFQGAYLSLIGVHFSHVLDVMRTRLQRALQLSTRHREIELQRCEKSAMAEEERRQRKVLAAECRLQAHKRKAVDEERRSERCNRLALAKEDMLAHAWRRAERHKAAAAERWNRRAMRREDILQRKARRLEIREQLRRKSHDSMEERLVRRISRLIDTWQRRKARSNAREVRQRDREQKLARQKTAARAREEECRVRALKRARWQHMMRRDITMAELLGSR